MDRKIIAVRFPDGKVRFGPFVEMVREALPPLFDSKEQAVESGRRFCADDDTPWPTSNERGVRVEVCDGMRHWPGRATEELFLGPFAPDSPDAVCAPGCPQWAEKALSMRQSTRHAAASKP